MALERLGVAAVVGAAGGVADVADGGPAGVLLHDAVVLGLVVEAKRLDDGADLLVGVEELVAIGIVGGHAGGELAAVLHVEQHPRHQPRTCSGPAGGQRRGRGAVEMINRRDAAFVVQFGHRVRLLEKKVNPAPCRQDKVHYRESVNVL